MQPLSISFSNSSCVTNLLQGHLTFRHSTTSFCISPLLQIVSFKLFFSLENQFLLDFILDKSAAKQTWNNLCCISLCVLQLPAKTIGISSFVAPGAMAGAHVVSTWTSPQAVTTFQSQPIRALCPFAEKSQRSAGGPASFPSRTQMRSTQQKVTFVCTGSHSTTK